VDFAGAVHHVYARGIEKRNIFSDDLDREAFLGRVGMNLSKWGVRCSAWALMPNHFHLLLQSDKGRLPSFMHCLLTGYSKYFNDRHKRVGHLFQNRYKSPIVGKSGYFRDVVRYIHLNPLRSGIVPSIDRLEEYPWTGHRRIVSGGIPEWQDTSLLQVEFPDADPNAGWVQSYRAFVAMTPPTEEPSEPVETLTHLETIGENPQVPSKSREQFINSLERISALHGVSPEQVLAGERNHHVVNVRRKVMKECRSRMGISIAQLGRWLNIKENSARYLINS
jgi:REP element-mobilizing transposase RayT